MTERSQWTEYKMNKQNTDIQTAHSRAQ